LKEEYFWKTPWWNHSEKLQKRLKTSVKKAREGEICRFEAHHQGDDGAKVKVDFSLRPVRDEEG